MFGHQDDQTNNNIVNDSANDDATTSGTSDVMSPTNNNPTTAPLPEPTTSVTHTYGSNDVATADPVDNTAATEATLPVAADTSSPDDLLDIKRGALQQLSPLIDHLDQTPEEKFKTTMMMIQAADNQSLIPTAYESAKQITDEKMRAQALLDVVNEINYFTHK